MTSKPVVVLALSRAVHGWMCAPQDLERLREVVEVLGPLEEAKASVVGPMLANAVVAITGWGSPKFDEALLSQAPKLKLIAHSAGSVKPIATEAMYERGVRITTAAAANARPVADTTVAMMVVMLKRIPWMLSAHGSREVLKTLGPVRELRDLSVGVIGASRVGREVILLLRSYSRLEIKVYDPYLGDEEAAELGAQRVTLEEACSCDVVTVHAPDTPQTRHMLNARTLALLPDHAVLLNTSRGTLIDEAALLAEVRRRPLYVYLDVTDPEPPAAGSPITQEKNIVITPHIAGAMGQARRDMGRCAIDEVLRFLRGEELQHEVTREMLPTQA